jgi:hypothetical protein
MVRRQPIIVVLERDIFRASEWVRQAMLRHVDVMVERDRDGALAHLDVPVDAILVVNCAGYEAGEVLSLVRDARSRDQPAHSVLLTDDSETYRQALARHGLVAEILASSATVVQLLKRLSGPSVPDLCWKA